MVTPSPVPTKSEDLWRKEDSREAEEFPKKYGKHCQKLEKWRQGRPIRVTSFRKKSHSQKDSRGSKEGSILI
jgi:hypothetical protein